MVIEKGGLFQPQRLAASGPWRGLDWDLIAVRKWEKGSVSISPRARKDGEWALASLPAIVSDVDNGPGCSQESLGGVGHPKMCLEVLLLI